MKRSTAGLVMMALALALPALAAGPAKKAGLGFLADAEGKTVQDVALFDTPEVKQRISELLGEKSDLVRERFAGSDKIEKDGSHVFVTGHKGGADSREGALFVANPASSEVWIWLRIDGNIHRYGPAKNPQPVPAGAKATLDAWTAAAAAN